MRIVDVVATKQITEVITLAPDAPIGELLALLESRNIGAVLIQTHQGAVVGIVSERDVVRHLAREPESAAGLLELPVERIMTDVVRTCTPEDEADAVLSTMTAARVRHLPVLSAGELTGIISIGDVVKSRIDQLQFERDQLDSYVHQT